MSKPPFPWHHYIKTVRTEIFFIILTLSLSIGLFYFKSDNISFYFLALLGGLIFLAFLWGYFSITPFRHILMKIEEIQVQLPHDRKLDLIYQKDEWVLLEEMLKLTETYINEQNQSLKDQAIKSDAIIEFIPDSIIIVDKFLNILEYNNNFKNSFIKNNNISIVNEEKLWKVFEESTGLPEKFTKVAKNGETYNLRSIFFEDLKEYYNISITPIYDSNKNISAALGIFHNSTQDKLNDQMRVDFVANVSHEIRTPLTSIKGYAQLLEAQKEKVPTELQPILNKINSNTERLKDLFNNLLKLSQIETQYYLDKKTFNLKEIVSKISGQIKGKYLSHKFEIDFIGEEDVFGDEKLLEQVFTNLIDNSIKYSDKDETRIQIIHTKSLDHHIIGIKDNGIGLNHDEMKRIFERFYRVQGKSTQAIEGSGLGLSIVKHIINRHGGNIEVKSEENVGSEFIIQLPF